MRDKVKIWVDCARREMSYPAMKFSERTCVTKFHFGNVCEDIVVQMSVGGPVKTTHTNDGHSRVGFC